MGFYAEPWLREARDSIKSIPDEPPSVSSSKTADFDKVADAVEKAIKAALIENHGSIPQKHDHEQLVLLCQATGVWDVLPPALKNLVQEVESYRSKTPTQEAGPGSSPNQMAQYFSIARRLIDYMEYHVIGNDSVLKRLKVA
jgi:HEPN domain-containing protein